jgi:hypothetical protein
MNGETALQTADRSGETCSQFLKEKFILRAQNKTFFLPDRRSSRVTDDETDMILNRSFECMLALMEFNLFILGFQLNFLLFIGFKKELGKSFKNKLMNEADWAQLVEADPLLEVRFVEVQDQIRGVKDSLQKVERLSRRLRVTRDMDCLFMVASTNTYK